MTGPARVSEAEQREVLLDLLAAVDAFCRAEGLTYYLYGGTLLGAIRHQGFIPWDDDIDLMMPREDFERFCETFADPDSVVVAPRVTPDFPYAYAKVCHRGTEVHEDVHVGRGGRFGINLDLFPLDRVPGSAPLWGAQRVAHALARAMLLAKVVVPTRERPLPVRLLLTLAQLMLRPVPVERLTRLRTRVATGFGSGRSPNRGVLATNLAFRMHESELSPASNVHFEHLRVPAPAGAEQILERIYGDFLTPPPLAERVPPHPSPAYWTAR